MDYSRIVMRIAVMCDKDDRDKNDGDEDKSDKD